MMWRQEPQRVNGTKTQWNEVCDGHKDRRMHSCLCELSEAIPRLRLLRRLRLLAKTCCFLPLSKAARTRIYASALRVNSSRWVLMVMRLVGFLLARRVRMRFALQKNCARSCQKTNRAILWVAVFQKRSFTTFRSAWTCSTAFCQRVTHVTAHSFCGKTIRVFVCQKRLPRLAQERPMLKLHASSIRKSISPTKVTRSTKRRSTLTVPSLRDGAPVS